jgi:two-component system, chemotaxis family, chemotaxis protein CheY
MGWHCWRRSGNLKHIPFIMVTAKVGQKLVAKVMRLSVSGFIVKPFSPHILIEKVGKVISIEE